MKKTILTITVLLTMFSCSNNEDLTEQEVIQPDLLSRKEINTKIKESLESTGDFIWGDTDVNTIYSALKLSNEILTIGYGSSKNEFQRSTASASIKDELIALVTNNEKAIGAAKSEDEEVLVDEFINIIDIKVTNKETIETLLGDSRVRYIEPTGYDFSAKDSDIQSRSFLSDSGCGYNSSTLASADYTTVAPGARVPWAFYAHNIPTAWNYSTGAGVTLAVIDTGLSPEQSLMNGNFNDGYSSGRTVEKFGTFIDSWWSWSNNYDGVNDKCGHGTSMASVAVAPRNNNNQPVGVAYNANLISYRAVEDVLINDYHEKKGVADALTALGNRSDVKVISMSLGALFTVNKVEDAVKYAYGKGKMIVAAGGTSTSFTTWYGVIFPASMSETVAVTGVKEGEYDNCDTCHKGSKIDFTIQMQRTNGTDNKIPVLSYYNSNSDYEGGSSIATATTAGIAALVWSKNPTWTRDQVLNKMKQSSDLYPDKSSDYGYGNIDALKAVQ